MATKADMQGIYKRQKTINEKADRGVNACNIAPDNAASFAAEYSTSIVLTTASFATSPERSDTLDYQLPNPRGLKTGAIKLPKYANRLTLLSDVYL